MDLEVIASYEAALADRSDRHIILLSSENRNSSYKELDERHDEEMMRIDSSGDEGDAGPVIGLLILGGAFVAGLLAIRRQRQSGRTSKFPRLG